MRRRAFRRVSSSRRSRTTGGASRSILRPSFSTATCVGWWRCATRSSSGSRGCSAALKIPPALSSWDSPGCPTTSSSGSAFRCGAWLTCSRWIGGSWNCRGRPRPSPPGGSRRASCARFCAWRLRKRRAGGLRRRRVSTCVCSSGRCVRPWAGKEQRAEPATRAPPRAGRSTMRSPPRARRPATPPMTTTSNRARSSTSSAPPRCVSAGAGRSSSAADRPGRPSRSGAAPNTSPPIIFPGCPTFHQSCPGRVLEKDRVSNRTQASGVNAVGRTPPIRTATASISSRRCCGTTKKSMARVPGLLPPLACASCSPIPCATTRTTARASST